MIELKSHEKFDMFDPSSHMRDVQTGRDNTSRQRTLKILDTLPIHTILDAPIGTGVDYELIKEKFMNSMDYYGLDFNQRTLDFCETLGIPKDHLFCERITETHFEDNTFDLVMSKAVIEHLDGDEYKQAIAEMLRISKKYFILVLFRGGFDKKDKVVNRLGFIEQDYTKEEIEACFDGLKFQRFEDFAPEDNNTYIHYLVEKI